MYADDTTIFCIAETVHKVAEQRKSFDLIYKVKKAKLMYNIYLIRGQTPKNGECYSKTKLKAKSKE